MELNGYGLLGIVIILLFLIFIIYLFVIPIKMANKRGRSVILWFLIGLLFSPFFSMLMLYFLGETDSKREERIIEEEQIRMRYRNL